MIFDIGEVVSFASADSVVRNELAVVQHPIGGSGKRPVANCLLQNGVRCGKSSVLIEIGEW